MSSNPFSAYLESKVVCASPLQLVHLAYEGAIEAVREARGYLQEKRIQERSGAITKAQQIIAQLQSALNFEQGGDVSIQLGRLYEYMQRRLTEANFKQIEEPLADVQGLLETLDEAWRAIAATTETTVTPAAAASSAWAGNEASRHGSSPAWMSSDAATYTRSDFTL